MTIDAKNQNRAILSVGNDDWPLPVPIVKQKGKWHFDSKQGRDEILFRRIGANELDAIQVCRGFVEAQDEYASQVHDDSGVSTSTRKESSALLESAMVSTGKTKMVLRAVRSARPLHGPSQEGYTTRAGRIMAITLKF